METQWVLRYPASPVYCGDSVGPEVFYKSRLLWRLWVLRYPASPVYCGDSVGPKVSCKSRLLWRLSGS